MADLTDCQRRTLMSLHRQLVAAFGNGKPPNIKSAKAQPHNHQGYVRKSVNFAIVISASGDVVDIERPPWQLGGERIRSSLVVPHKHLLGEIASTGFLCGHSRHTLGFSKSRRTGQLQAHIHGFSRFRSFHQAVLGASTNRSMLAFLQFLQSWDPQRAAYLDHAVDLAGATLAFRFRYDDCFLHDSQAARSVWAGLLRSASDSESDFLGVESRNGRAEAGPSQFGGQRPGGAATRRSTSDRLRLSSGQI